MRTLPYIPIAFAMGAHITIWKESWKQPSSSLEALIQPCSPGTIREGRKAEEKDVVNVERNVESAGST